MKPTLTRNGSDPNTLLRETRHAAEGVKLMEDLLYRPNARDWPGDLDGFRQAQKVCDTLNAALREYKVLVHTVRVAAMNAQK